MSNDTSNARRDFLKKLAAASAITSIGAAPAVRSSNAEVLSPRKRKRVAPNDRLQIATIGTGIIGFIDTQTALQVPGVELVAAADLYDARLTRVKEVFGQDVDTTRRYEEILDRSDVDAVIVSTPDHWHAQIAQEAMEAGKDVYLEKPMIHDLPEGPEIIQTAEETGRVLQVGSQYVSSIVYDRARELYEEGAIGEINMIEARYNRNSAIGAWLYSIPPNVSEEEIAWERFLGDAPEVSFDPERFFRWRNYWDYGTAMAGDLFVHLLSSIHYVLNSNGPEKIFSEGGIRYWEDREVPDVQLGLHEYPATESHPDFTLAIQSNFADGSGGGSSFRITGSEGVMDVNAGRVQVSRRVRQDASLQDLVEGYNSVSTFSEAVQQEFIEEFKEAKRGEGISQGDDLDTRSEYAAPEGYDMRLDHFLNFFDAVREGGSVVEDAVFGYRAAAPALLTNMSYRDKRTYEWDPEAMEVRS